MDPNKVRYSSAHFIEQLRINGDTRRPNPVLGKLLKKIIINGGGELIAYDVPYIPSSASAHLPVDRFGIPKTSADYLIDPALIPSYTELAMRL